MKDEQSQPVTMKQLNHVLAQYMGAINERFDYIEQNMMTKADGNRIYNMIDGLAKRITDDEAERAAAGRQLDRHEKWIGQLAENTGTKLVPKQ